MPKHILVIDDERPIRKLIVTLLTREQMDATAVPSFEDAVLQLDDREFDLVICDVVLGSKNGIDLLRIVKKRYPRLPVVMLTGHPTVENAARSVRHGAFDYLVKPVEREKLLRTVDVGLRHKQALDREAELESEIIRQKRLYQSVVEDQTEMICRFTPGYILTFVNDTCAAYFTTRQTDLIGTDFLAFAPKEDREGLRFSLDARRPDQPVVETLHRVHISGAARWVSWTNRAVFDESGRLREFQSVGRDITERKEAQEALSQSRRELETVFQSIPEGIVTVGADMTVERKNRSLDAICPLSDRIRPGTLFTDLNTAGAGCSGDCEKLLYRTIKTGKTIRDYQIDCHASDSSRQLLLTCAPLVERAGKENRPDAGGAILIIRDITKIRDLEARLQNRAAGGRIIGQSRAMRRVHAMIDRLADLDNTVLVTGESGTGKELVMEALHIRGVRSQAPLIRVNCSALPEHLLQSELFGHTRGAFTGAVRERLGRFQAAEGGTLFLDEIGDLPLHVQLQLLRVLERKEFERVGEDRTRKADVRIIAATHVDLDRKVREGSFREDFYYRLNVINIHLPPLRDRLEDIPDLAEHFCRHYGLMLKKDFIGFDDDVMDLLGRHQWPGNVRELKHAVEYACILCPGGILSSDYFTPLIQRMEKEEQLLVDGSLQGKATTPLHEKSNSEILLTRESIGQVLQKTDGNKAKAARLLGVSRSTFYRRMREYGLASE